MKDLTNYGGFEFWLHTFLVNRALKRNLQAIRTHECSICDGSFRTNTNRTRDEANDLFVDELAHLQQLALSHLMREIDIGLLD